MSLIEEAAKRLKQLEQAGVEIPMRGAQSAATKVNGAERLAHATKPAKVRAAKPAAADPAHPQYREINFARLQAAGFVTPSEPDSKLLHEFRVIKRPLIQTALGKTAAHLPNSNLIMVTSALPGEGKSFVALNLAMSIAMEVDSTVLLVDADVVAPAIPDLLGITAAKGLMDVLTDSAVGVGEVLLKTNVERLSVLPAGIPKPGAPELLASDAMTRVLSELAGRYPDRIVVFDSPPLLATTESRTLAAHMGQVLVVVEAGRTSHALLESALSTVESCPKVLTVLNKAPETDIGSYYGVSGNGH